MRPSGLAAELVIPEDERKGGKGALQEQFVRTPYAVSFVSGGQTFILVTLHVKFGDDAAGRTGELQEIADWLADWAKRTAEDYNQNLICLGDFNIDRRDDPNFKALTSTGLEPPEELQGLSRTVSDKPGKPHYYDQIAWFNQGKQAQLTLDFEKDAGHAGRFEWTRYLLSEMDPQKASWHISDHYPLWVEFGI